MSQGDWHYGKYYTFNSSIYNNTDYYIHNYNYYYNNYYNINYNLNLDNTETKVMDNKFFSTIQSENLWVK